nr:NHL repeat-containing protein [Vibrio sp. Of7-15]
MTCACCLVGCNGSANDTSSSSNSQWNVKVTKIGNSEITSILGFKGPYGLTLSDDAKLYVPDIRDGKVIRFSDLFEAESWLGYSLEAQKSGWFDESYSVDISNKESLKGAHSVTFNSRGQIIIADFFNKTVNLYDSSGKFLSFINSSPSDTSLKFEGPANAHIDQNGNLWVSDWTSHRVYKFDSDFNFIGWLGATATGSTNGFVQTGKAISSNNLGGFNKPHMIKVDSEGFLYVVETGNHRVQKFTPLGESLGWIGAKQSGGITSHFEVTGSPISSPALGGFNQPVSLSIFNNEKLIIADNGNNRVQSFDLNGKFIGWVGGSNSDVFFNWTKVNTSPVGGKATGYLLAPFEAIQVENRLYIADGHNNRVQIYKVDPEFR